jgi:hypothetical protein
LLASFGLLFGLGLAVAPSASAVTDSVNCKSTTLPGMDGTVLACARWRKTVNADGFSVVRPYKVYVTNNTSYTVVTGSRSWSRESTVYQVNNTNRAISAGTATSGTTLEWDDGFTSNGYALFCYPSVPSSSAFRVDFRIARSGYAYQTMTALYHCS